MKALIVVDVQNDFLEGGNLPVTGGKKTADKIAELIEDSDYDAIAYTRDWHKNPACHFALKDEPDYRYTWPVHCVAGTRGAMLYLPVDIAYTYYARNRQSSVEFTVFDKGQYGEGYSGFAGVNEHDVWLNVWLRQHRITDVDVVGLAFDYCVQATALAAADLGFKTRVLKEYTASVNPDNDYAVINRLKDKGVEVI